MFQVKLLALGDSYLDTREDVVVTNINVATFCGTALIGEALLLRRMARGEGISPTSESATSKNMIVICFYYDLGRPVRLTQLVKVKLFHLQESFCYLFYLFRVGIVQHFRKLNRRDLP
ncbi:hypothetical protein SAMN06265218_10380 [Fodinibius sediminis]|uniref:Uncharacterized protein n=1 Tax=Fodinibius sediminis TaxID=1214077 RepID=A0A521BG38_9BACT|nr:hypothetical protein SAMN06265218_10380 [Fodinibius sediminis]